MKNRRVFIICCICIITLGIIVGCANQNMKHKQKIEEIDGQVKELLEQEDDLYAIGRLSSKLFSTGATQIITDAYVILDENNDDITEYYIGDEDSLELESLLKEYSIIHIVFQKDNALVLECGSYLNDTGNGSYQRRVVITNDRFDEDTIINYFDATAGQKNYEREVDANGVVVWNFDNGANKENIKAVKIYDKVWSFEKTRKDGIWSFLSV